jgi:serine protease AprX
MKAVIILSLLFCFVFGGFGQSSKWIIQFTDKKNSPYSINNPAAYLSQKAIARRNRFNIPIDNEDLPVDPNYIQQVLGKGKITFLSESKWLNQILIYCTDLTIIDSIDSLFFVKTLQPVDYFVPHNNINYHRFKEKIEPLNISSSLMTTTLGDTLNYGTSSNQIHIHNGEFLHNKGYTGDGITIAILDAGFYHYKELDAFDSIRSYNKVLGEKDFVDNDNSVDEDNAHGMYCLSIIAANIPGTMVGTAPHAAFWLLRSENDASESPVEEQNWVAAAEFADSAGADMISSSLGYYYFNDPSFNHSYNDIYANSTIVSKGAAIAAQKGMIVTNSAGNEGNNQWHYIIFPADTDSVCAVGATDGNGQIASFSSYGYRGKIKPNVVSVGLNTTIFGTNNIPVLGSGTSFSNPNINGLIACLWEAFPAYNNMTILNAVYQSADRYNNPDNRYGFGIPNMQKAYLILKKKQNLELYGNEWLFAGPDPFTNRIAIKLIGQTDGNASLYLQNAAGNIIDSILLITEQEEVYDTAFINLDNLAGGQYIIKYSDGITTRTITLSRNRIAVNNWLMAVPVPFTSQLTVYINAPENGKANLRLTDVDGRVLETKELNVVQNNFYTINFKSAASLGRGIYFIEYSGGQKKTIKVVK